MKANYVTKGENINYTNPTDEAIEPGSVIILNGVAGIAACLIHPGELGTIATVGVWEMPKGTESINIGDKLYYNADSDIVTKTETAVYMGFAAEDSGESADIVRVALNR